MSSPLFQWLNERSVGIHLHPTSLPGDYCIGTLGQGAYRFVDFLEATGMKYWQVCPLGPTGYGDSPYQCFSSFAGNPFLIDFRPLEDTGLITPNALEGYRLVQHERVDYSQVFYGFWPALSKAYIQAKKQNTLSIPGYGDFSEFAQKHDDWLAPYALFKTLKDHFAGQPWYTWPENFHTYKACKNHPIVEQKQDIINIYKFSQYIFFNQWASLKKYAHQKNIKIIGDVPIFVAMDSADVWSHPELFKLNASRQPTVVAGVPPDYFSPTGQLWGNPVYDWKNHHNENYAWWMKRIQSHFYLYDVLRIDHFRAFDSYWEVPAGNKDATKGTWAKGPGLHFFKTLNQHFHKELPIIAEDLGMINEDVTRLRDNVGLPGMAVLQFAFGGDSKNPHLPHNHIPNQVVYPATHDNDTCWGWYQKAPEHIKAHFKQYLRVDGSSVPWDLIRYAYQSVAKMAIIQMQDLLNLGSEARFNTPGTSQGNWSWRFTGKQLDGLWQESSEYLKTLAKLYNR